MLSKTGVYAGLQHFKKSFDNNLITVIASAIILVIHRFLGNGIIEWWLAG